MTPEQTHTPIQEPVPADQLQAIPVLDYEPAPAGDATESRAMRLTLVSMLAFIGVFLAAAFAVFVLANGKEGSEQGASAVTSGAAAMPGMSAASAPGPTADDPAAKGVAFEKFAAVDPTLPAVPAGKIKHFRVDVFEHVTKVADGLAPTKVWSFGVNGKLYRGTGVSAPIVVNQGDEVEITLVNGATKAMNVTMPHSLDFHSAEIAPNKAYTDVAPGESKVIRFQAKHPGVFMYHCATQPVLMHTGAGMVGMMVVKPRHLPKVDRELWLTQQEYYLGAPGKNADMTKMSAKRPDVIAFNGYAEQYKMKPITVLRGEKIRMYVLDAGPSIWSAFHVIGTVFDRTVVEGVTGHDSQTVNLAPSQGGWVEFTLDQEGNYPFVTHAFGDMTRGAVGVLHTSKAPHPMASGH
jgi:nitrite reductase (NO-forming)